MRLLQLQLQLQRGGMAAVRGRCVSFPSRWRLRLPPHGLAATGDRGMVGSRVRVRTLATNTGKPNPGTVTPPEATTEASVASVGESTSTPTPQTTTPEEAAEAATAADVWIEARKLELTPDPSPEATAVASVGENSAETADAAAAAAAETLLKAPFSKVEAHNQKPRQHTGLFPWTSSPGIPARLVPGTPEFDTKGLFLGGNLTSSNPRMDGFATSCFFLRVPFWDLVLFRRATEQDLADSMAWAFGASVRAISEGVTKDDNESESESESETDQKSDDANANVNVNANANANDSDGDPAPSKPSVSSPRLRDMMEATKLAKLFESANEFGKDSIQVKLETKPILYNPGNFSEDGEIGSEEDDNETTLEDLPLGLRDGPKIVSLFVFPFLSRDMISDSKNPTHLRKYSKLMDAIVGSENANDDDEQADASYSSSIELSRDLMEDFSNAGVSENTVVCQVLVPCHETFWVKDLATGRILQGETKPRKVLHLVRFEQVTKTHIIRGDGQGGNSFLDGANSRWFPFEHELGEWVITDIDDLCDGNLLL